MKFISAITIEHLMRRVIWGGKVEVADDVWVGTKDQYTRDYKDLNLPQTGAKVPDKIKADFVRYDTSGIVTEMSKSEVSEYLTDLLAEGHEIDHEVAYAI